MSDKIILTELEQEYLQIFREMCKRGTKVRELEEQLKNANNAVLVLTQALIITNKDKQC